MKDKEYFFFPDWKERKKKFLRVCNEVEFKISRLGEIESKQRTKRIIIQDIK